jgi:hypothetical protein
MSTRSRSIRGTSAGSPTPGTAAAAAAAAAAATTEKEEGRATKPSGAGAAKNTGMPSSPTVVSCCHAADATVAAMAWSSSFGASHACRPRAAAVAAAAERRGGARRQCPRPAAGRSGKGGGESQARGTVRIAALNLGRLACLSLVLRMALLGLPVCVWAGRGGRSSCGGIGVGERERECMKEDDDDGDDGDEADAAEEKDPMGEPDRDRAGSGEGDRARSRGRAAGARPAAAASSSRSASRTT